MTVTPEECCMEIAHNDTDCDVCKTHFPMFHGTTLITCIYYIQYHTVYAAKTAKNSAVGRIGQTRQ